MLTPDIKQYLHQSVLCWLATASSDNMPNVSPKEIFTHYKDEFIIVANISSPKTVKNIQQNQQVCISFIDVFVQKGFQLKGIASIVKKTAPEFKSMEKPLLEMTEGKFPFASITKIKVEEVKAIIAPKYWLYPETTEAEQIESARKQYQQSPTL